MSPASLNPADEGEAMSSILSGGPVLASGIGLLLVQITFILIVTRALGGVLKKRWKQPGVVAEVLGGLILGPSVLGQIPGYLDTLFPQSSLPGFELVANLGLVLYLFLVGLELQPGELLKTGKVAACIALSGIFLPFLFGIGIAAIFYEAILKHDPECSNVSFLSLAVFTSVGMSITAFPVLARILSETRLIQIPIGVLALSAAAFNDAIAWCLLALAIALVGAGKPVIAIYILLTIIGWALFLVIAVKPLLSMAIEKVNRTRSRSWRNALLATVFICIFISSWFTAMIGTDAIFGAFLLGVILPRDEALIRVVEKIEDIVMVVFIPLYFTLAGLRTNVASISSARSVGILILVLIAAVGGKLIGCTVAARLVGVPQRESLAVGVLMNTRGLVELIVLNIGLTAHVINTEVFTIMVLMALFTTCMTSPLIRIVYPKSLWEPTAINLPKTKQAGGAEAEVCNLTRRLSRIATQSPGPNYTNLNLNFLVPAEKANLIINGLYILLPGVAASSAQVLTALFIDSTSTATVIGERIGALVTDADAREIGFAARLLGADVNVKQVVTPTKNAASQVIQMVNNASTDVVLLPWIAIGEGAVDYELSMWDAKPHCDVKFVLFRDEGLLMPRFVPGSSAVSKYAVLILLYNQALEDAVLDVAAGMNHRKDLIMHLVVYRGATQQTLDLLDMYKLPSIQAVSSEEGMVEVLTSNQIDLIVYGNELMSAAQATAAAGDGRRILFNKTPHHRHRSHRGGGSSGGHSRKPSSLDTSSSSSILTKGRKPLLLNSDAHTNASLPTYGIEEGNDGDEKQLLRTRDLVMSLQERLPKPISVMEVHAGGRRMMPPADGSVRGSFQLPNAFTGTTAAVSEQGQHQVQVLAAPPGGE